MGVDPDEAGAVIALSLGCGDWSSGRGDACDESAVVIGDAGERAIADEKGEHHHGTAKSDGGPKDAGEECGFVTLDEVHDAHDAGVVIEAEDGVDADDDDQRPPPAAGAAEGVHDVELGDEAGERG